MFKGDNKKIDFSIGLLYLLCNPWVPAGQGEICPSPDVWKEIKI